MQEAKKKLLAELELVKDLQREVQAIGGGGGGDAHQQAGSRSSEVRRRVNAVWKSGKQFWRGHCRPGAGKGAV